ncbi:protein IQ-DOMAIN 9-like isoform X1 [Populus nigra]|uniref:protein IQ-DOMAIN 9-like isoform X1 n=1 Tax=Populus nigra TaxID=3691 RepID=UPI002B26652D|nr:protein IQ-DOMAIN 9-like isoform X1 [Populus nigra]XP_061983258.1 protein IQ-DOMAIN 9-like isoform X1 [Populus nigra]XP_061983260.1 protein IQ-DOMAIN 9-like isoform X1 [Populus nigra]
MGSGDWFKTIISIKKVKDDSSKQAKVLNHPKGSSTSAKSNGFKWKNKLQKESASFANGSNRANPRFPDMPVEDLAATRIQTAFRAYRARKTLRCLKGKVRLQIITQNNSFKKQAATTLNYLHSWSQIQAQIRARKLFMVSEGRLRQKKLENQLKLEAKLHDLEVEWSGGSETMEKIVARIHQREEAAVKRERAMAYAFSHQWRASYGHDLGVVNYELGKANWGWSWKERWIAARPWESRVAAKSVSPKKMKSRQAKKVDETTKLPTRKTPVSSKPSLFNGKGTPTAQRLSYPPAEKRVSLEGSIKSDAANNKREQLVS